MILIEWANDGVVWRADLDNEGDRQRLLDRLNDTFPGTFEFVEQGVLPLEVRDGAWEVGE